MKKINGNDILLAIGEIDETLLSYPLKRSTNYRRIRSLSLVASLILCVGVVLTFYAGVVFRGAMKNDANDAMPPENSGSSAAPDAYDICNSVLFPLHTVPDGIFTDAVIYDASSMKVVSVRVQNGDISIILPSEDGATVKLVYESCEEKPPTRVEILGDYAEYSVVADALYVIEYDIGGRHFVIDVVGSTPDFVILQCTEVVYE